MADDADAATQYWRTAAIAIVVIGSTLYLARSVLRRQNGQQDAAGAVDELFQPSLSTEEVQEIIASKHAELQLADLDLDALGESAFPDMPNVVLVQICEELLLAGTKAVKEEDHKSAVFAFSEALTLEMSARPDGATMADLPMPLKCA